MGYDGDDSSVPYGASSVWGWRGFRVSGEAETTAGCEACLRAKTGEAIKNDNAINLSYNLQLKHADEV